MKAADLLFEANIANNNYILSWLTSIWNEKVADGIDFTQAPMVQQWYLTVPLKYIKSSDPDKNRDFFEKNFKKVTEISADSPAWLKTALEKNQDVYDFIGSSELKEDVRHLIDWLNSIIVEANKDIPAGASYYTEKTQRKKDAETYLDAINNKKIPFDTAMSVSKTWFKNNPIPDETVEVEPDAVVVLDFPDGFSWKFLSTNECLEREGKTMGHCVGSNYRYPGLKTSKQKIISLRDPQNMPVGTMRIKDTKPIVVVELKGKQNQPMSPKFSKYARAFIRQKKAKLELQDKNDVRSLGWLIQDGKIYDEAKFREWLNKNIKNINNLVSKNQTGYPLWTDEENYIWGNYDQLTNEEIHKFIELYESNLNVLYNSDDTLVITNNAVKLYFLYTMQILPADIRKRIRTSMGTILNKLIEGEKKDFWYISEDNHGIALSNIEAIAVGDKKILSKLG